MPRKAILSILLVVVLALPGAEAASSTFHFALSKSAPEADAEVESPDEIRLWFTEAPEDGTTSIRLVDEDGEALETSDVDQDAEDGKVFAISIAGTLAAGTYTVAWRAMGADGHVVRDTFSFSVVAQ